MPFEKTTNENPKLTRCRVPHLHGERGVHAVVEVEIGGAVVGPVCDPQVAVPDATVQLLLYGELLQSTGPL